MADIETVAGLTQVLESLFRQSSELAKRRLIKFFATLLVTPLLTVGALYFFQGKVDVNVAIFSILLLFISGAVISGADMARDGKKEEELDNRITEIENKIKIANIVGHVPAENASKDAKPKSYFDGLVEINLTNLTHYYRIVRQHAHNSFLTALISGILGFILVIIGLYLGYETKDDKTLAYVTTGAGVATQFIAAIFFFLYNRTVLQLKQYHDSLLKGQNVFLAFKTIEEVDSTEKAAMLKVILENLMK